MLVGRSWLGGTARSLGHLELSPGSLTLGVWPHRPSFATAPRGVQHLISHQRCGCFRPRSGVDPCAPAPGTGSVPDAQPQPHCGTGPQGKGTLRVLAAPRTAQEDKLVLEHTCEEEQDGGGWGQPACAAPRHRGPHQSTEPGNGDGCVDVGWGARLLLPPRPADGGRSPRLEGSSTPLPRRQCPPSPRAAPPPHPTLTPRRSLAALGTSSPSAGGRWGPDPRLPWPRPRLFSLALESAREVPAA